MDDAFEIAGRGIVLVPSIREGRRYHWLLVLDEGTAKPPSGTEVLIEHGDPADALAATRL